MFETDFCLPEKGDFKQNNAHLKTELMIQLIWRQSDMSPNDLKL